MMSLVATIPRWNRPRITSDSERQLLLTHSDSIGDAKDD
jgi:hypothetical protein